MTLRYRQGKYLFTGTMFGQPGYDDKERTLVDIYSVSHTFVAVHKWMTQSFGSQMKGLRADFGEDIIRMIVCKLAKEQ